MMTSTVTVSPFSISWAPTLWTWLHERPEANFDDYGPLTFARFEADLIQRLSAGERIWGVLDEPTPVGVIAFLPLSPVVGTFHGICFTESACGKGIAGTAVQAVLEELWAQGIEKVCASYFAHNQRVHRFLARLGFVEEGCLVGQTRINGRPVDMRQVAIFRPSKQKVGG